MRILLLIATVLVANQASAQGNIGVGMQVGDATGITGKAWLGADDAVQIGLGLQPLHYGGPVLSADWLHEIVEADREYFHLGLHLGLGAGLGWSHGGCYRDAWGARWCEDGSFTRASLRVPVGFDVMLAAAPVELFIELIPGVQITPSTGRPELGGVLGGRFYF